MLVIHCRRRSRVIGHFWGRQSERSSSGATALSRVKNLESFPIIHPRIFTTLSMSHIRPWEHDSQSFSPASPIIIFLACWTQIWVVVLQVVVPLLFLLSSALPLLYISFWHRRWHQGRNWSISGDGPLQSSEQPQLTYDMWCAKVGKNYINQSS